MTDVTIPSPGESITEVRIGAWKRNDGDWVEKDELLNEIESDKATLELLAPAAGTLKVTADSGTDLTADTDDPTRRLIRQVLGAVAEFDRRVTVLKLRAARERIRGRGKRCEGRKPFGSRSGEREALDRIRELYRKPHGHRRRSLQAICEILNAEGVATRSGKPWHPQVLSRIVRRGFAAAE